MTSTASFRLLAASLTLAGALTLAHGAKADSYIKPATGTPVAIANNWYIELEAMGERVNLPKFNHYQIFFINEDLFANDTSVIGAGGIGKLGYMLKDTPTWMGARPRVEFAISGFQGDDKTTKTYEPGYSYYVHVSSIDGDNSYDGNFERTSYSGTLKTSLTDIEVAPSLKGDFAVSPNVTLTPSVAGVLGYGKSIYDLSFNQTVTGGYLPGYVNERVSTWRMGPEIGVNANWQATPQWVFHLGATVAGLYQMTDLRGEDCATGNVISSSTASCDASGFNTTTDQSDSTFGARIGQTLGMTYALDPFKISAGFFGSWNQNVAGVRNTNVEGEASKVRYDSAWSYGGVVGLTVPLP